MRKSLIDLFVTTVLYSPALARDDSWYVSLDGKVSEEDKYLPTGRVPDLPDEIIGYNFGSFDGDYDFPGIQLGIKNHPVSVASAPIRQLRIDRLAHRYRHPSHHHSAGQWVRCG